MYNKLLSCFITNFCGKNLLSAVMHVVIVILKKLLKTTYFFISIDGTIDMGYLIIKIHTVPLESQSELTRNAKRKKDASQTSNNSASIIQM